MHVTYKTEEIMNLVNDWIKPIFEDGVSVQMKSGPNTIFFIQANILIRTDIGIFVITRRVINKDEALEDVIFMIPNGDFINSLTLYKMIKNDLVFDFIDVTDEPEFQLTDEINQMIMALVNQILSEYSGTKENSEMEGDE